MTSQIELPKILTAFVSAQNDFNVNTYTECFADNAIVHDEGKDYNGKSEIKQWNKSTNEKYRTQLEPIGFSKSGEVNILTVIVSGTFDGSPLTLKYHFILKDNKITSLRVTNK